MFSAARRLAHLYHATDYRVTDPRSRTMIVIGRRDPALDRLLARQGARQAVFVAASNPHGRASGFVTNARRTSRLRAALRGRVLVGEGVGRDGTWPPEPSLLTFGLGRRAAAALGRRWRQNAVVFLRHARAPVLLMLG